MTQLLIRLFIKDSENIKDPKVRGRYGYLGSVVGIGCNIFLFFVKLTIGTLIHSIAVTADAFNNLSDMVSSIVTLVGFKLTNRPPDKEHPFGHGRVEYLSGMMVAAMILLVGVELGKSSFNKIKNPEPVVFNYVMVGILILSVCVKLWMCMFNKKLGKKIGSMAMEATAADSLNDVIATSVVILSVIASKFISYPIDGYMGVFVALFVLYSGYGIMKETINPLLGMPPDPEMVRELTTEILSDEHIIGMHDLIIHNYGPGRCMASAHAEIPANMDILKAHEVIDDMENAIAKKMGIFIVIHMDPVCTEDEEINEVREKMRKIILGIDRELSFHDFRMVKGERHTNVIFDIVITAQYEKSQEKEKLYQRILQALKELNPKYELVLEYDRKFV